MEKTTENILRPGRKKIAEENRRKIVTAYLTDYERSLLLRHFDCLSTAVREMILPPLEQKEKESTNQ